MDRHNYYRITYHLITTLKQDPRVLGLVALGSMAEVSRKPDRWSDHDFFVITEPGAQEDFRTNRNWLPDPERIVLHARETAHGVKTLYDDGHLLEFAVFDADELHVARANDYRVLFDRADITAHMAQISTPPDSTPPVDPAREFALLLAVLHVGAGRYARGEQISAHAFVKSHALHHLLRLLTHLHGADHTARDTLDPLRRFEQAFPDKGAAINAALLRPTPETALALLDIAVRHAQDTLPDYPAAAVEVVREMLNGFVG